MENEIAKRLHLDPQSEPNREGEPVAMIAAVEGLSLNGLYQEGAVAPTEPYKSLPKIEDERDWKYGMRRDMQEIIPGLYLGPYAAASKCKLSTLKDCGITHIICIRHLVERSVIRPMHEGHFKYLVLEMENDCYVSLIPYCHRAMTFIDRCFSNGGKVLVHGNEGVNRSAALVSAYIMATYGVSVKKAVMFVQRKRFSASINGWFTLQLKEYEAIYKSMHDVEHSLTQDGETTRPPCRKRHVEEISCDNDDWENEIDEGQNDVDMDI